MLTLSESWLGVIVRIEFEQFFPVFRGNHFQCELIMEPKEHEPLIIIFKRRKVL